MAIKSASFDYRWWIPKCELASDQPTAFLIRQMGKKDFDIYRHKQSMGAMIPMLARTLMQGEDENLDQLREMVEKSRSDEGFDGSLYARCIKEIRNAYFKGEFVESITDPKDIVDWIAGLQDLDTAEELDEVLWTRSTLTEFESANFTPTSGCSVVCRTADEVQTSEK